MRKAVTEKLLMLGIDGMDPRLSCKYMNEGKMPNLKKYVERGACREDLVMLGGHPTVTPSMWTTLATGCYANVHGVTGFWRHSKTKNLDTLEYNMDSRNCTAEPLWNVFAEAGKKTLVLHWPGSSWPPTSDSENLYVIDGSTPGSVGMGVAQVEEEFVVAASEKIKNVIFKKRGALEGVHACVITDLEMDEERESIDSKAASSASERKFIILRDSQKSHAMTEDAADIVQSPIKEAKGWASAPADAKEFTLLLSGGFIRRPSLILKNTDGIYDRVAIYSSKKATEPIVVLEKGVLVRDIIDDAIRNDERYRVNRNMKLIELAEDGSSMLMYVSAGMDIENDKVFSPKRIYKDLVEHVGYVPPTSMLGHQDPILISDCMLANWYANADWQADAIQYLIAKEDIEVVFSHFHSIDMQLHMFMKHLYDKGMNRLPVETYYKFLEDVYVQVDYYLGKFLHFLDEGWTIAVFSDHGQVCATYPMPHLGETSGVNVRVMQELGLTALKTDENGNELEEIDWSKTKAIAQRETHIYVNLKGRDPEGIVEPEDKYEVEEEIMTKLYGYRDKVTGHRIVSLALRNKDAVLLGLGGPESGDIVYFLAEGYNTDHADSLSTTYGEAGTSVSPMFVIAGPGVKSNFKTDRIIRQVDFAPTMAYLGGVRMPAQCEGAIVYQILSEEF